jgi:hypothetical protein
LGHQVEKFPKNKILQVIFLGGEFSHTFLFQKKLRNILSQIPFFSKQLFNFLENTFFGGNFAYSFGVGL